VNKHSDVRRPIDRVEGERAKARSLVTPKPPLIVVRRRHYEAFIAGLKAIEYRHHRRPFTIATFYPGRVVRLAYNFNVKKHPSRLALVRAFDVLPAASVGIDLSSHYPDLSPTDEIAMISVELLNE
jgi:hypothetical protein